MEESVWIYSNKKREVEFDIAKGILILCVVVGHGGTDSVADFVYRFHMPLFFILSGYFMQKHTNIKRYAKRQFIKLMIPYFLYMTIDFLFFDHLHNFKRILQYLWGGRFINGVYWYITCFLISSIAFVVILKYFTARIVIFISIICGGLAFFESKLIPKISLLKKPGIPFNADVALLCIGYLVIGYYGKAFIDKWRNSEQLKVKLMTIGIVFILVGEYLIWGGRTLDMKQVLYQNMLYTYFVPIGYGLVLVRLCHFISGRWGNLRKILQVLGQLTIPIMYLHEPLNRYLQFAHENIWAYTLIGIGVPTLCGWIVQRYHWGKYIGIYRIQLER